VLQLSSTQKKKATCSDSGTTCEPWPERSVRIVHAHGNRGVVVFRDLVSVVLLVVPVEDVLLVLAVPTSEVARVVVAGRCRETLLVPQHPLKHHGSEHHRVIRIGPVCRTDSSSDCRARVEDLAGHDLHETHCTCRASSRCLFVLVSA